MSKHFTLPTDLAGKPYSPVRSYSWLTDDWRDYYATEFEASPSQVEWLLDNRDAQLAKARERVDYESPYGYDGRRY